MNSKPMNALLQTLEKVHRIDSKQIAMQLGVTLGEYVLLATGIQELTSEQVVRVAELLQLQPRQAQPPAPITIYNIGQNSHAATNVTVYIEDWNTSQTPINMKTIIEPQLPESARKSVIVFTPQLVDTLQTLKRAIAEFTTEMTGKTYEQFIAERDCINELLQEVDKKATKF